MHYYVKQSLKGIRTKFFKKYVFCKLSVSFKLYHTFLGGDRESNKFFELQEKGSPAM
jgi:hypothetical protein